MNNVPVSDESATRLGLKVMQLIALVGEQHRAAVLETIETAIDAGIQAAVIDLEARLKERLPPIVMSV